MLRFEGPLQADLSEEVAASLGQSARRLRKALDLLQQYDTEVAGGAREAEASVRLQLMEEAAEKLWGYVVQRELVGLRDPEYIREQYRVPSDVWRRMGPKRRGPALNG